MSSEQLFSQVLSDLTDIFKITLRYYKNAIKTKSCHQFTHKLIKILREMRFYIFRLPELFIFLKLTNGFAKT